MARHRRVRPPVQPIPAHPLTQVIDDLWVLREAVRRRGTAALSAAAILDPAIAAAATVVSQRAAHEFTLETFSDAIGFLERRRYAPDDELRVVPHLTLTRMDKLWRKAWRRVRRQARTNPHGKVKITKERDVALQWTELKDLRSSETAMLRLDALIILFANTPPHVDQPVFHESVSFAASLLP